VARSGVPALTARHHRCRAALIPCSLAPDRRLARSFQRPESSDICIRNLLHQDHVAAPASAATWPPLSCRTSRRHLRRWIPLFSPAIRDAGHQLPPATACGKRHPRSETEQCPEGRGANTGRCFDRTWRFSKGLYGRMPLQAANRLHIRPCQGCLHLARRRPRWRQTKHLLLRLRVGDPASACCRTPRAQHASPAAGLRRSASRTTQRRRATGRSSPMARPLARWWPWTRRSGSLWHPMQPSAFWHKPITALLTRHPSGYPRRARWAGGSAGACAGSCPNLPAALCRGAWKAYQCAGRLCQRALQVEQGSAGLGPRAPPACLPPLPPAMPALPATANSNCAATPSLRKRLTHVIVYSMRCPLQLFFVSNRLADSSSGEPVVDLFLLNIDTKELQQLQPGPPVLMANGGTPYGPGKVVVTSQVGGYCMEVVGQAGLGPGGLCFLRSRGVQGCKPADAAISACSRPSLAPWACCRA
jgi:hypothetical protein